MELQQHLTRAGVKDPQEAVEALHNQDVEWSLLVDTFARPGSDGGRAAVVELLGDIVTVGVRTRILNQLTDTQQRSASSRLPASWCQNWRQV